MDQLNGGTVERCNDEKVEQWNGYEGERVKDLNLLNCGSVERWNS